MKIDYAKPTESKAATFGGSCKELYDSAKVALMAGAMASMVATGAMASMSNVDVESYSNDIDETTSIEVAAIVEDYKISDLYFDSIDVPSVPDVQTNDSKQSTSASSLNLEKYGYSRYLGSISDKELKFNRSMIPLSLIVELRNEIGATLAEVDFDNSYSVGVFGENNNELVVEQILAHFIVESDCGLTKQSGAGNTPVGLGQVKPSTLIALIDKYDESDRVIDNIISIVEKEETKKKLSALKNGKLYSYDKNSLARKLLLIDEVNIYATALNLKDALLVIQRKEKKASIYTSAHNKIYISEGIPRVLRIAAFYHGGKEAKTIEHYYKKIASAMATLESIAPNVASLARNKDKAT